jgi:hypothetical protein
MHAFSFQFIIDFLHQANGRLNTGSSLYFRELSIDELPGLTSTARLATALAACSILDMPVNFIAPAFGFQKNFPFPDSEELQRRVWPSYKLMFFLYLWRLLGWCCLAYLSLVQLFHWISQW